MAKIKLKVQPSSSKRRITYLADGTIKVYLNSPPENNKANKELIEYLADKLNLSKSDIIIKKGGNSRNKIIDINGINNEDFKKIFKL